MANAEQCHLRVAKTLLDTYIIEFTIGARIYDNIARTRNVSECLHTRSMSGLSSVQ